VTIDLDGDNTIVLTSGSFGMPKAVLHSYGNHYFSALGSNRNIAVQLGDRWLLSLPLYHVGGLGIVFRMLLGGGAVVVPEGKETIGASVEKYGVTHLSLVSTQLYRWLNEGVSRRTTNRLKAVLVGGGPVPATLIDRAWEAGIPLLTTYGSTEMASQVTTTVPGDQKDHLHTSGKVLDYRHLRIDNQEILVKGKTLFKGYVDRDRTALSVDDQGWFRTGDLGRLDDDGYLTCLGRKDNMFVSGGENIFPEEIERQLLLLPQVAEAVVVAREDREFGYRPVAFVKMQEGAVLDREQLVGGLERHIPRFKIPVVFYEWPEQDGREGMKPERQLFTKLAHERNGR
jgi:O-succinylbenzoic acid--CoA ligase